MIKIKNLTKSFGDAKILKGINLEIKQNFAFCLVAVALARRHF